jgi:hypothetical protein
LAATPPGVYTKTLAERFIYESRYLLTLPDIRHPDEVRARRPPAPPLQHRGQFRRDGQPVVLKAVYLNEAAEKWIASGAVTGLCVETLKANSLAARLDNAQLVVTGRTDPVGTETEPAASA